MNETLRQVLSQSKPYAKAIEPAVVFLLAQTLLGVVAQLVAVGVGCKTMPTTWTAALIAVSGLVAALLCFKWFSMPRLGQIFNVRAIDWRLAPLTFVGAVACIFANDLLGEQFDLPNFVEKATMALAHNPIGILAIAVVGPVVEEFIFREAILGGMLRGGQSRWGAVLFSALLFGLVHLNPAQVPFAFAIGIVFGFIYLRTGNIILTSIIHIFNNATAVLQIWILGDKAMDFRFTDYLGGVGATWCWVAGLLVVGILLLRVGAQSSSISENRN